MLLEILLEVQCHVHILSCLLYFHIYRDLQMTIRTNKIKSGECIQEKQLVVTEKASRHVDLLSECQIITFQRKVNTTSQLTILLMN
jgi:hypothetical protein